MLLSEYTQRLLNKGHRLRAYVIIHNTDRVYEYKQDNGLSYAAMLVLVLSGLFDWLC